ncbi:uncharacterized protein LOC129773967 [Toxorhynchites rutilus septentrionalis]|uniref:uncharacterized protein LOC129773967 n=1 Tax=Toxorhynchites rutilus septentrionalis TaxID=329112 RepID=UPI00247B067A|nr:uncharacterized protein LOC129773967 [Toxorhynchites rutilus septentrionalis]
MASQDPNAELMQSLTKMIADALKSSIQSTLGQMNPAGDAMVPPVKPPSFSVPEYRISDNTSVTDYFKRFEWSLQLSKIPAEQYPHYARVHMGTELNNAIKFLISPRDPADISFDELRSALVNHFDQPKNKYVESIKFREIVQQSDESVSSFVLRLRQGAAHCEYGEFLDRMLIEQLLHGFDSRELCDEIIAKKPATFNDAFEIAHTIEATRNTAKEVRTVRQSLVPEGTNKLGYEPPKTRRGNPNDVSSSHLYKGSGKPTYDSRVCSGCGGQHTRSQCKFRNATCFTCEKKGHIAKACRSSKYQSQDRSTSQVQLEKPSEEVDEVMRLSKIHSVAACQKKVVSVEIDGLLEMEVDTGAPCGIISEKKLRTIKPTFTLKGTDRQFSSYTGHKIMCMGLLPVNVSVGATTHKLNLYVVSGDYDALFGREWISQFMKEVNLNELFSKTDPIHSLVSTKSTCAVEREALSQLLVNFEDVFSDTPGKLIGPPASVHLKPGTTPIFVKARDVPLALKSQYAEEIDKKLAPGAYERVDYSEWASPTHIVVKKNGKLRITGNYKPTVNPRMIINEHPIPKIEYIFNQMNGASLFCHLDVTDAYTHLPIDVEFQHVLTLNTPTHGLVRPTRAVYGAANIPAIWQRRMETVFQGLSIVFCKEYSMIYYNVFIFLSLLFKRTYQTDGGLSLFFYRTLLLYSC